MSFGYRQCYRNDYSRFSCISCRVYKPPGWGQVRCEVKSGRFGREKFSCISLGMAFPAKPPSCTRLIQHASFLPSMRCSLKKTVLLAKFGALTLLLALKSSDMVRLGVNRLKARSHGLERYRSLTQLTRRLWRVMSMPRNASYARS